MTPRRIGIIGGGPRALSLIERLSAGAAAHPGPPIEVTVWERGRVGAGRIWDPQQSHVLLMNTRAREVTIFPDESVDLTLPLRVGPSLWHMIRGVASAADTVAGAHLAGHEAPAWALPQLPDELHAECERIDALGYPTRALYGHYLSWCYEQITESLPTRVSVRHRPHQAVHVRAVEHAEQGWIVTDDQSTETPCDAVVLALGWVPAEHPDAPVSERWIAPDNPIDQPLGQVLPGERVLLRGFGMSMFDNLARLTLGRGGVFERTETGMRYRRSGREPRIVIGSRSGTTFWGKPNLESDGSPASAKPFEQPDRLSQVLRRPGRIDFIGEAWPALLADTAETYYRVLFNTRPELFAAPWPEIGAEQCFTDMASTTENVETVGDTHTVTSQRDTVMHTEAESRFDICATRLLVNPEHGITMRHLTGQTVLPIPGSDGTFTSELRRVLTAQVAESRLGKDSALLRAFATFTGAKIPFAEVAEANRFTAHSRAHGYARYRALTPRLSGGPPLLRVEQLIALIDAQVVTAIGPAFHVQWDNSSREFVITENDGRVTVTDHLVESWVHGPSVVHTADPLLKSLRDAGHASPFVTRDETGVCVTDALAVHLPEGRLVNRAGLPVDGLYSVGIPSEEQLGHTIVSPVPGSASPLIRHTDRVAVHLLGD